MKRQLSFQRGTPSARRLEERAWAQRNGETAFRDLAGQWPSGLRSSCLGDTAWDPSWWGGAQRRLEPWGLAGATHPSRRPLRRLLH